MPKLRTWKLGFGALAIAPLAVLLTNRATAVSADVRQLSVGGFAFEQEVVVPGSPETIYDAATGDISGWWDHTFSESPMRLYIDARPGGGFWEIFDASGDGAKHATVIYAERGVRLRMDGPLGFSGQAIQIVISYDFEAMGDSTKLKVTVNAAGELEDGWAEVVQGVWHHFLVEQFKPYVEAGRHLQ